MERRGESPCMAFSDLPPETRDALFEDLGRLYEAFDEQTRHLPAPRGSCAGCGRCCTGPPMYMTCSDLELAYAMSTPEAAPLGARVRFETTSPDRRHAFTEWTCPFYSQAAGCTVYARRPFACRVFGRYARMPIEWDFCVYRETAHPYAAAAELPLYHDYIALLARYPAHRGYPFLDGLPYTRPAVEMLLGTLLPWSPAFRTRIAL